MFRVMEGMRPSPVLEAWGTPLVSLIRQCWDSDPTRRPTARCVVEGLSALAADDADQVPPEFICPLSLDIMTDPVTTPSGISYERAMIVEALRRDGRDPSTRQPCDASSLRPNLALRQTIEVYRSANR